MSEPFDVPRAGAGERQGIGGDVPFPIVGVGASAGGLEAFTQMLEALPPDTGMGFVLVQHLAPDHESALAQILSRVTSLPVSEIKDHERVLANHVYVIPRDASLTIAEGVLKLEPRKRTRTVPRPIDSFFQSLAQDQRERAVGVVLSGTGNDGTLGLEAIKAEGGITIAQDDSAKYDGMPRSAVAAGCVDLVLPPVKIAQDLARIAKHPLVAGQPLLRGREPRTDSNASQGALDGDGYKKILLLLRNYSGAEFSLYKSSTIQRRIGRRLVLSRQNTLDDYARFLRGNKKELDALYLDVLISVTSFFRNPETFEVIQHRVLPELLMRRGDDPLRCWVLGCSTGQEAYSIAMAYVEAAEKAPRARKLQIFATDLNDAVLEKARHGLYAKNLTAGVTAERLRRFFVEEEGGYRVSKALREMVVFARQNVIADPPFSRMDLISCRNLLIYLEPGLQRKILPTFHYALRSNGFLILGASESVSGFTDLFEPVDKKHKIYSKLPAQTPSLHLPMPKEQTEEPGLRSPRQTPTFSGPWPQQEGPRGELNAQREADRITVSEFSPPGVLVNSALQVLQFRGPTGAFLEPPVGKASFDVLKMAREGLMLPLRKTIALARKTDKTARKEKVRFKRNGKNRTVSLKVIPLKNLRERCFLILFQDAESGRAGGRDDTETDRGSDAPPLTAKQKQGRIRELNAELAETREYLQSIQEQHEAANEELQAANEEVQSANEELQSINEELETSKEEMESANEELTTVNEEMSSRNLELNRLNDDLTNLQTSTTLAIVLLGRDLVIRRFSPQAEKQFGLSIADLGRPIGSVRHTLALADATESPLDLESLSAEVISEVREQKHEVRHESGGWYSLRVRPYMTLDNKVDGATLVLVDVDALKTSEQAAEAARDDAESIIATVREPLLVLDRDLRVKSANRAFHHTFRTSPEDTVGSLLYEQGDGQWDIPHLRELLEDIASQGTTIEDFQVERPFRGVGTRTMLLNARRMVGPQRKGDRILLAIEDVTDRKHAEETQARLAAIVSSSDDAIISEDLRGVIQTWNQGAERLFAYDAAEVIGEAGSLLLPPDRVDEDPALLEHAERDDTTVQSDTVRRRKDGGLLDISLTVSPIRNAAGRIIGTAKIARDITGRKQMERELRQFGADLSDAAGRRDEFLAMLGHELRNPLAALTYGLEAMGHVPEDRARTEELRAMLVRQTGHIGALLDQLLDIARVVSGKVRISDDRVDLADVVRAAVETARPLMEAQRHDLTLSLPPDVSVCVKGDAVRLTQVVENLLTNALKYTNEGGRVGVSLEVDQEDARLIVRDTGIGMDAGLIPHIFEVFTQAPRALDRAKGGLGLGLPLVRRLVEMHGGNVSASSPGLGSGSEFVVTLPLLHGRPSKDLLKSEPASSESGEIRPRRILVVDDQADAADALEDILEDYGHQALAVNDGPAALLAVRSFDPEVVLLDLGLPEMDGYEVARRIREEHPRKEIRLIAVTGYQSDPARLKAAGFDQHLLKPPNLKALSALLAGWDKAPKETS